MTLNELGRAYVSMRHTIICEFYGDFDGKRRELRAFIVAELNPLLERHGADPVPLDLVPDPDAED